jgi:hypothetical protein
MGSLSRKAILSGVLAGILMLTPAVSRFGAAQWVGSTVEESLPAPVHTFFVSPTGSSTSDGSAAHPWSLSYALRQPAGLRPGDAVAVRGGVYNGSFTVTLNGVSSAWITVQAYRNERVTLHNANSYVLDIAGCHHLNLVGLEIAGSESTRDSTAYPGAYGIRVNQGVASSNVRFINMVIHDMQAQGMGFWQALVDSEVYGSLIYFNGTGKLDHGVYVHNVSGTKKLVDNIVFDNASHGVHGYAETADKGLTNIVVDGNTLFDNGSIGGTYKRNILVGGLTRAVNPVVTYNCTYYPGSRGQSLNLGYSAGSTGGRVQGNYFAGGSFEIGGGATSLTMSGNFAYAPGGLVGFSKGTFPSNTWTTTKPTGAVAFVRPNKYDSRRAHVTVYNWSQAATVSVPAAKLAGVPLAAGAGYELHNAQNFWGDVVSGVYDGVALKVPMTGHSVAQPVAIGKPASTFPTFGAFVLILKTVPLSR